jgi:SAM-dependent methyltransferase
MGNNLEPEALAERDWFVDEYLAINKANWDSRVPHHLKAYDIDHFRSNPAFVSKVVQFDLPRLGDIRGLDIVHLQCHIGTDTISLARLGAKSVTGLDFSPASIHAARDLAKELNSHASFVEGNVYDAVSLLNHRTFDLVYTGIGALCWLPSITEWARTVSNLLRPGGALFIRDAHPMLQSLSDYREDGLITVDYPYFEDQGLRISEPHSYVDHDDELTSPETVSFNHGLGEIITALLGTGMNLIGFEEHNSAPWNPWGPSDEYVEELVNGEFRLRELPNRLAATFTLQALKPTP